MGFISGEKRSLKKLFVSIISREPNFKREKISFNAINGLLRSFPCDDFGRKMSVHMGMIREHQKEILHFS
jgi:hypothetical protein